MKRKTNDIVTYGLKKEPEQANKMLEYLKNCPIPEEELMSNIGLFLSPQTLSRVLLQSFLYSKIMEIQGVVMELGCRWGQNLALYSALRGIYEPYNRLRKIIGFDTFEGFINLSEKDGTNDAIVEKNYSVTKDYDEYLHLIMNNLENESPLSHIKKYEIVKGDAGLELEKYLERNPETIVALAYFDMDLYAPTVRCLNLLKNHLTRGSIIAFDELNEHAFPGETIALAEVFGLSKYSIKRFPFNSRASYIVID